MRKSLFLLSLLLAQSVFSQMRFSQFYSSPLLFNPANTGRYNMSQRLIGGFRSEKNAISSYNQSFLSIESKILTSLIPENDCFAIGIFGLNEKSLGEGMQNNHLSFSIAYQKGLDIEGKQQIGIGFQTIISRKKINPTNYTFEDQLNSWIQSGFTNIDIFQFSNVDVSYIDLNIGIIYQGKIDQKNFLSTSISLHHANRPTKLIQGGELRLDRKLSTHIAWEIRPTELKKIYTFVLVNSLNENRTLLGGILYQSSIASKNYHLNIGGAFKSSPLFGEYVIPMIGMKFKEFQLNMTYDINISKKNTAGKGASEITLCYVNATSRTRFLEDKFMVY